MKTLRTAPAKQTPQTVAPELKPFENLKKLQYIQTGGTIDASWDPAEDTATNGAESVMGGYLNEKISPNFRTELNTACLRDSRDITDKVRKRVLRCAMEADNKKIKNSLITHGTFTMQNTGLFLEEELNRRDIKDHTTVLTGSFYPSDNAIPEAFYNLGFATGCFTFLKPGTYIAVQGNVFNAAECRKANNISRFVGKPILDPKYIDILNAGGTINARWLPASDTYAYDTPAFSSDFFQTRIHPDYRVASRVVSTQDSRHMENFDRSSIKEAVLRTSAEKILITHGIFTMLESAEEICKIEAKLKKENKVVVFTGAFVPPEHRNSDVPFNVGFAMSVLNGLEPGVYIAMHGYVFKPQKTEFDYSRCIFVEKTT